MAHTIRSQLNGVNGEWTCSDDVESLIEGEINSLRVFVVLFAITCALFAWAGMIYRKNIHIQKMCVMFAWGISVPNLSWLFIVLIPMFTTWRMLWDIVKMWLKVVTTLLLLNTFIYVRYKVIVYSIAIFVMFYNLHDVVSSLNGSHGEYTCTDDHDDAERIRRIKESKTNLHRSNRTETGNGSKPQIGPKVCYDFLHGVCVRPNCKFPHIKKEEPPPPVVNDVVDPFKDGVVKEVYYYHKRRDHWWYRLALGLSDFAANSAFDFRVFEPVVSTWVEAILQPLIIVISMAYRAFLVIWYGAHIDGKGQIHKSAVFRPKNEELGETNVHLQAGYTSCSKVKIYPALLKFYTKEMPSLVNSKYAVRTLLHASGGKYFDMDQPIVLNTAKYYVMLCEQREIMTHDTEMPPAVIKY